MVEFLIQHGADVNEEDNEGWTPLHATASCGYLGIARHLIEHNANLSAVNCDGNLPIDVTDLDCMRTLLENHLNEQGIDCDAESWLRNDALEADRPYPLTGATAVHVAAAKGYTKVLAVLLATGADIGKPDNDGWTPLHAATHWEQKEATQMLVATFADMDAKNHAGQTPMDEADPNVSKFFEKLQKKNNKRTVKREAATQIYDSDNDLPPKIVYMKMKPNKRNIDDFLKTPSERFAANQHQH